MDRWEKSRFLQYDKYNYKLHIDQRVFYKLVSYIKNNLSIIFMSDIEKRIEERELSKKKYYIIRKLNNISGNLELLRHEIEHEQTLDYHELIKAEIEFYKIKLYEYSEVYFHLINKIK